MPRRTALILPVPQATPFYDGPPGVPGHVTILFPFADDEAVDEEALAELFARHDAFDFTLDRIERFADGTPWLHPEPSAPFRVLRDAVWARWPEHPPYDGTIADPTPHVTVMREDARLPMRCRANEVWLLVEEHDGSFSRRRAFALGQGVA